MNNAETMSKDLKHQLMYGTTPKSTNIPRPTKIQSASAMRASPSSLMLTDANRAQFGAIPTVIGPPLHVSSTLRENRAVAERGVVSWGDLAGEYADAPGRGGERL
jgi:hypothetical protein